jgi:tetratricopeptide (TPR) repeat protein
MKTQFFTIFLFLISQLAIAQTNSDLQFLSAIKANDFNKIRQLSEAGANVNATDSNLSTMLMWAVYKSDLQTVKYLVGKKAKVEAKGVIFLNDEKTSYYGNLSGIAAGEGKTEILKFLIETCKINTEDKEYDAETKTETGWTALQWAASSGRLGTVEYLIEKRANVNANHTSDKGTPLIYALQNNHIDVAVLLIEKGADVNAANSNGTTSLMTAISAKNIELCILLWQNKASLAAKDKEGNTALDLAIDAKYYRGIEFLQQPDNYKEIQIKEYWDELNDSLNYYNTERNYKRAIFFGEKAVATAKKEFGATHVNYGLSLKTLAMVYRKDEKYKEAELLTLQVIDFYKESTGNNSIEYATALNQLGLIYEQVGDTAKTEKNYTEALQVIRDANENGYLLESILFNLGVFYKNNNESLKAEPLLEEMTTLQLKLYGNGHPDFLDGLGKLASVYAKNGKLKDALTIRNALAETCKTKYGETSLDYVKAINQSGMLYERLKDKVNAEASYQEAIGLLQKMKKPDNLIISVLYNLADFYTSQYQQQKATELYEQRLEKISLLLGESHPDYAGSINSLALLYESLGQFEKAKSHFLRAIAIRKITFGEAHPSYATSLNNLGGLYMNLGQAEKAKPLYLEANKIWKKALGENHPEYATSLNNLGFLYNRMGQYEKAEGFYQEAKEIKKRVLGETHPGYAMSLNNLAALYSNMGQYEKAERLYIESKEIRKKVLGESHPDYANSLNNLAGLYESMGQYEKAEMIFLDSQSIMKKIFGEAHVDYASNLNNLAVLYKQMGQYEKARLLFIESKEVRKKVLGETHPVYAGSLNNLAVLYEQMGQYQMAEPLYLEAKEIWKKTLGETHPDYATSLNSLAILYKQTGQYEKAEPLYMQSKEIRKKALGENHPDYAASLNNLAVFYEKTGQYEKAEPLYMQSKEIRKNVLGEMHPAYALSLNNLGHLYIDMGQYKKAEQYYQEATAIRKKALGKTHPDYALSLNNLAVLYKKMGQYKKAEPLYVESKGILKKAMGETHPDYALSLNNLAAVYESMGQYEKAESIYLESKEIRKKTLGEAHPDYALSLNNLAYLYESMGQYEKAEPIYLQSKETLKRVLGENHPDYALSLNNLANLYNKKNENEQAEKYYLEHNLIEVKNMLSVFNNLSESEKGNYLGEKIILNDQNNSFVYNYRKAASSFYQSNYNLQLLLKSLSLTSTKSTLDGVRNSKDSSIQKDFADWQANKIILSRQYSLPVLNRREDLKQIEEQTERLEKILTRKSAAFKNQQQALQIKIYEVHKNLQLNEVAIEFVKFDLYNKKWTDSVLYAAYVLTKNDSVPFFVPLCEEKQLQQLFDSAGTTATAMVNKFYRGLEIKNKNITGALGTELYKLIWQPLEPYLTGVQKISYSPAGKLYSIAFHALPVDSATVLMDKYQLQQYTSTRQVVLREQEKKNIIPQNITLFGDAIFTLDSLQIVKGKTKTENVSTSIYTPQNRGTRGGTWSSLPGTAQEVATIQKLFEKNTITTKAFTQTTASEESLKALSGNSPQILHIATHGFFLPEPDKKKKEPALEQGNTYSLADDPLLRSGLILAGGNYAWSGKTPIAGIEDGIATAYEISQLDLSNTELVVLSACETALGDVKGSEGVFGLQRAFKMAGVKKMIVSLWQVPDKETAELMTAFYTYWMKGKTINEAFTQAQAEMRKKYAPFFWAAFVLVE